VGLFKGIKSIVKIFFLALITVVIIGVIIKLDYSKALETPNSSDATKISLEITPGETTGDILNALVQNDLIKEKWLNYAKIYLRLKDLSSSLQAGTYSLPKNLTILEIIETLQNGRDPDNWVTIPEGLRKDTMADLITKEIPTLSKETFLALTIDKTFIDTLDLPVDIQDLEGYLFPDTYAFAPEATEADVITKIVENFKTIVGTEDSYKDIIFASIVEREGFDNEDRPTIAGILIKRYNEGWKLGSSVTVLYHFKTWKEETLTTEDLDDTSNPYNTYALVGLPPTPICNPGLESIEAMRNPVETDYYYFIRGKDTEEEKGETHYGITYEDHQENINNYLR